MSLAARSKAALAAGGPLDEQLPAFTPRDTQRQLAESVGDTLADGGTLIAEAGTGTGKTFAYLAPALLSGQRVVLSTGTRTLQDQLYHRDLPRLAETLESPARLALLKGRGNYLCHYRLERAFESGRFESRELADRLLRLREWAGRTRSGDLAEAPVPVTGGALLSRVTSTADNCLGTECPFFDDCFLMQARRRAQEADIVVVNHHLLMADWAVRAGGHGEVLPAADAYILDEAHQLPEIATQFFGLALSSRQLGDLARDARLEQQREAGDSPAITATADALGKAVADFRLVLGRESQRGAWAEISRHPQVADAFATLDSALTALAQVLEPQAPRGRGLESCARRATEQLQAMSAFREAGAGEQVQWYETYAQSFMLRLTPLEIAETFRERMGQRPAAWVFTSATLSVGGSFRHFSERLGLVEPRTLALPSPFDYERNALLLVPEALPAPSAPGFLEQYLGVAERVLRASGGRAFLLFTSYRALDAAAAHLRKRLPFPVLVQGDTAQNKLLERFRVAGDAVLLGTQSFWEGVDVPGEALSCVMIDRLPFASPADPVVQARIEAARRNGANPFAEFQLPQAVITLRQGVGRLIRGEADRGVLVIGDPRMLGRSYGRVFRDSLPPMPLTRSVADVEGFFAGAGVGAAETE